MAESTGWSEIITEAAGVLIDDIRWTKDASNIPARFFRAKSDFVLAALPRLNRPPDLEYVLERGMTQPKYDSCAWISTAESTTEAVTVQTGMTGYELCSVSLRSPDGIYEAPYTDFTYDPTTGDVTFGIQTNSGLDYELDFYTDGKFPPLTPTQMRLFSLAVAVVWDERMDRTWLFLAQKIKDSSFETVNEGNYAEKISQRLLRNKQALSDELCKYEQDCAYRARFEHYLGQSAGLF